MYSRAEVATRTGKDAKPAWIIIDGHVLDVTDWMYLMENGTIMNRSQFRKFGIKVAELVATMRPVAVEARQLAAAE